MNINMKNSLHIKLMAIGLVVGIAATIGVQFAYQAYKTQRTNAQIKTSLAGFSKATDKIAFVKEEVKKSNQSNFSINLNRSKASDDEYCRNLMEYIKELDNYIHDIFDYVQKYDHPDLAMSYWDTALANARQADEYKLYNCPDYDYL